MCSVFKLCSLVETGFIKGQVCIGSCLANSIFYLLLTMLGTLTVFVQGCVCGIDVCTVLNPCKLCTLKTPE